MIRTSKYSKEPFDINKIEEYLIKEGKYYFFADSKRPGYISGPFNCTEEFIKQYEKYRGREIVSFKELDDFKKKRRLKKKKVYYR